MPELSLSKRFARSRRIQLSSFEFSADQIEAVKRLIGRSIAEVECELIIIQTLADQRRSIAAKLLGISIRTLRNKIHGYAGRVKALPNRASTVVPALGHKRTKPLTGLRVLVSG